jgi:hypothetical protein
MFGVLNMWESFMYNGSRYMKNSPNTAVSLDTNTVVSFNVRTYVEKD